METKTHVCPVWVGYILASPMRKLFENPENLLSHHIKPGMKILEVGPGMGFFTIPMARMTGKNGRVYCVDIQKKMLEKLEKRASRKHINETIDLIVAGEHTMNIAHLKGVIDFTLLAYVVHEIPDKKMLFSEIALSMKQGAKVLILEPKGHVNELDWNKSLTIALESGFDSKGTIASKRNWTSVLIKK